MPLIFLALAGWLAASVAAAAVLGRAISRADALSELDRRRAALAASRAAGPEVDTPRRTDPEPVRLGLAARARDGVALSDGVALNG